MQSQTSRGDRRARKAKSRLSRFFYPSVADPATHQRSRARARRFLSYYRPHLPLLAAVLCSAMLVAATAIAMPLLANYLVSNLPQWAEMPDAVPRLLLLGTAMLGLFLLQALATYFVDYQGHVMGARIEAQVRHELFAHCQKLSFGFYDRQRTGQLMSRISHDSLWLGELFHHGPEDLAIGLLKFVGAIAVIAWIDPFIALCVSVLIPFAIAYALHFNRRMNIALRAGKERMAGVNERVEDALGGIRVVQSFANEADELRRFDIENQKFLQSRKDSYRSEALLWSGMDGFAQLVTIVVLVVGTARIVSSDLTAADILTLLLCVGVLLDPIRRFDNFIRLWQEGHTGFIRAMELLEERPEIVSPPDARPLETLTGAISFRNVAFSYGEEGRPVLRDLNVDIQPGEFVALVGPSGVGKSTLCALIPRFYDVTQGSITLDGRDVRDVPLSALRQNIGVVQQDIYLFSGTVGENLRYGRPDATDAEIIAAAKAANAHDFICLLPQGYDTDIGQRGVKLSGGQKQRLTIARAFLKNPPILIFDEATSALDNDSEHAVQKALLNLAQNRTTIVIAHRLSTVRHADRILVLTENGIAEQGTHETLMATGGVYARLQTEQASI